jgi:hypothetical protein
MKSIWPVKSKPRKPSASEGVLTAILLCLPCLGAQFLVNALVNLINLFWVASLLVLSFDFPKITWLLYVPMPVGLTSLVVVYGWKASKAPSHYFTAILITLSITLVLTVVILLQNPFGR